MPVAPGELLQIVVGGAGVDSAGAQSPAPPGGSPGGGGAGALGTAHTSATGGGASSINRGAQTLIIVGGGGGGAHGGSGGHGGLTGTDGTKNAGSTAGSTPGLSGGNGGAGGTGNGVIHNGQAGSAGQGGAGGGGTPLPVDGGGGGGGGAVGGGGGGGGPGNGATGGGGGSSFDSTGTATFQTGVREGDGQVTLTYDCPPPTPPCAVQTFDSPGVYTFKVPDWVTEIEPTVYGAQGGRLLPDTVTANGAGGLGAGVLDLAIPVTPGELLEIVVGGAGGDSTGAQSPAPPGGSPGGGGAGAVGTIYSSAGGGGASAIRRGPDSLVIAAGGGGGARSADGGHGGQLGTDGEEPSPNPFAPVTGGLSGGHGGAGGVGFPASGIHNGQAGSAGQGGTGGGSTTAPLPSVAGGGGGGVIGGGGGGGRSPGSTGVGAGGGGSSAHAVGPATYQTGVREGNGLVTIGFACEPPPPPPPGNVSVDKRASDARVTVGDTVTYRLVAKNNGAGQADGVVVEDRVPSKLDVRGASSTQGDCTVAGNQVRCPVGTLAPGAEATVTIRATAVEAGQSTNTGIVVADSCPAEACDKDPAPVTIIKPTLGLTKTADERRVRAGEVVTYTIRVNNPSKRAVRNVRTCDHLPAGLVAVRATPKVRVSKGRYCWTANRIGAGKSKRYELTARTLPGAAGRTINRATAESGAIRTTAQAVRTVQVLPRQATREGGVTG